MKHQRTYTVVKTFLDKRNRLQTQQTGIHGGTEAEALHVFNTNVAAAGNTRPRMVGVTLIDAAENVIAEWTKPVAGKVVA